MTVDLVAPHTPSQTPSQTPLTAGAGPEEPTTANGEQPGARTSVHLTDDDVEAIGRELDELRERVVASLGARDAAYIRRVIAVQRSLELGSRVVLLFGRWRPAWVVGTTALTLAKVLDNMEIGHNVLHGQWDWMRDPKINSATWQWDHASPPEQWQRAHNEVHHAFTNIVGMDNDLGYGIMRVTEDQPWKPRYLFQPVQNALTACIFEWGIAMYDADLGAAIRGGEGLPPEVRQRVKAAAGKAGKQALKDFVVHPALAGRGWKATLTANLTATLIRNLWSHSVIMCGHFPEGVETFEQDELDERETRAQWYVRQMLGSADISGPPLLHLLTGNLSRQIEHHLFPDLPSSRYAEIARHVQDLFERYGLRYHSRPLHQQLGSAWHKVVRLSLPDHWWQETNRRNLGSQLRKLARMTAGRPVPA